MKVVIDVLDDIYEFYVSNHDNSVTISLALYVLSIVIKQIKEGDCNNTDCLNCVLDKIRADIENHCGLLKENHCKYCSYCNSVMGVREMLEIIDKYKAEIEPQESEEV